MKYRILKKWHGAPGGEPGNIIDMELESESAYHGLEIGVIEPVEAQEKSGNSEPTSRKAGRPPARSKGA